MDPNKLIVLGDDLPQHTSKIQPKEEWELICVRRTLKCFKVTSVYYKMNDQKDPAGGVLERSSIQSF